MTEHSARRGEKALQQAVDMPLDQAFPFRTDMPWLRVERPPLPKATPGPEGLRLRDVENEYTRDVPDVWPHLNDLPRGAIPPRFPTMAAGYTIFDKISVWSENCIDLYEDAIRDRWSSAMSIPWETLAPLPEAPEAAIDQVCTELSEQAYLDIQVLSSWLERISYGFKEVKNFLSTYIFDRARHVEAFRKRALANGGGLGIEGPGIYHRAVLGSLRFPDLALALFLRAVWTWTVCEALAARPRTEADRTLFGLAARDCNRHIAYVQGLVGHTLARDPERAPHLLATLMRHEFVWAAEMDRATPFDEALALALADDPTDGMGLTRGVRHRFVERYLDLLDQAGLPGRRDRLHPRLKACLDAGVER